MIRLDTVFQIGDVVQTPAGQRGQIVAFVDGRADVRYYRTNGTLASDDNNGALIHPYLLKFAILPHKLKDPDGPPR